MQHHVIIAGAGKIGSLIACLLAESGRYQIDLIDKDLTGNDCQRAVKLPGIQAVELDINDPNELNPFLKNHTAQAIISSLPFFCNVKIAKAAKQHNLHYFDLTEDVETTDQIEQLAKEAKTAFAPQCGLAPGFISIAANHLMQDFDTLDTVKMRVGALPQNSSHILQYAITWSIDGLINEYINPCEAIRGGKTIKLQALKNLEKIQIDGIMYEAFNTSGGLGSLVNTYKGKVKKMNYKTIRYPGHCKKLRFLINDLGLNEDIPTLKHIMENSIPTTYQDVVIIYVSITGHIHQKLTEKNYVKKVYPAVIAGHTWSAIQISTATSLCTTVDLVLSHPDKYQGFVLQEHFSLDTFLNHEFGKYYRKEE